MECSGRRYRHSAALQSHTDFSRKSTTTRFYSADNTSTSTTNARSQTYTVSASRKESKQIVQSIRSSEQPNQQNVCFLCPLQLQISLQLYNQLSKIRYQIKAWPFKLCKPNLTKVTQWFQMKRVTSMTESRHQYSSLTQCKDYQKQQKIRSNTVHTKAIKII